MKINLGGIDYSSVKITAAMSRRAMELNIEALDAAAKAAPLRENPDAAGASALLAAMMKNIDEKAALICAAFGGAFSPAQLLEEKGNAELNTILQGIVRGI